MQPNKLALGQATPAGHALELHLARVLPCRSVLTRSPSYELRPPKRKFPSPRMRFALVELGNVPAEVCQVKLCAPVQQRSHTELAASRVGRLVRMMLDYCVAEIG